MISELHKFGVLMIVTLVSAIYYSLVFFPAISYQFGPQFKEGNIYEQVIKPAKEWFKRRDMRLMNHANEIL